MPWTEMKDTEGKLSDCVERAYNDCETTGDITFFDKDGLRHWIIPGMTEHQAHQLANARRAHEHDTKPLIVDFETDHVSETVFFEVACYRATKHQRVCQLKMRGDTIEVFPDEDADDVSSRYYNTVHVDDRFKETIASFRAERQAPPAAPEPAPAAPQVDTLGKVLGEIVALPDLGQIRLTYFAAHGTFQGYRMTEDGNTMIVHGEGSYNPVQALKYLLEKIRRDLLF